MQAGDPPLSKKDRVGLIFAALQEAPPASTRQEALELMDRIFRAVEDIHSGVPHLPFHVDRLYPPAASMERKIEGKSWLRRYRHTNHYTLIGDNGAIQIRAFVRGLRNGVMTILDERTEFDKTGADGRRIEDMD